MPVYLASAYGRQIDMKPAIFYTLKRAYNAGIGYEAIAVTSQKGSRWFGRDLRFSNPTHGTCGQITGRFETEEAARAKIEGLKAIRAEFEPQITAAQSAVEIIRRTESRRITAFLAEKIDA